jgi:hypothetical protein
MFRALLGGLGLRKPVAIRSVFPDPTGPGAPGGVELREEGYVHVGFSGEPYYLDCAPYDLNLIMAPDDPSRNVVAFINFAANAHEFDLWPLFAGRATEQVPPKFAVAVVSSDIGIIRQRFLTMLHARHPIDSCGRWMNTTGFLAPRDEVAFGDRFYPFLGQYKFMVCFENTKQPFYLTEKLANAYAAGCVPVYWGAPESTSWLNPRAFLYLEDESLAGIARLIDRMMRLAADDAAYRAVHREPLLAGPIPEIMRLERVRQKIEATLRRSRPDAF